MKCKSKISKDIDFQATQILVGRRTTSSGACNQAETIKSYQHIHLLLLTASHEEYSKYFLPLTVSCYYGYYCIRVCSTSSRSGGSRKVMLQSVDGNHHQAKQGEGCLESVGVEPPSWGGRSSARTGILSQATNETCQLQVPL